MIIADAGPLVAILNADDKYHAACVDVLGRYPGPIIVPAPVVTEVAFLVQRDAGSEAEAQFLDSLVRRELIAEDLSIIDYQRMAALVRQYADFPLGISRCISYRCRRAPRRDLTPAGGRPAAMEPTVKRSGDPTS